MASLPISFPSSGMSIDVSVDTPLISALRHAVRSGLETRAAVEELMAACGMLARRAGPEVAGWISDLPAVRSGLERFEQAGFIVRDAGDMHVRLTTLADAIGATTRLPLEAGRSQAADSAAITVSATAELVLEIDVLDAAGAAGIGMPIGPAEVLHRCRLAGALGIKGRIAVGVASSAAEAAAGAGISWLFRRHRQDAVVNSLLDAALDLIQGPRPWNLRDVHAVLDEAHGPGTHLDALAAIDLRAERRVSAAAGLKMSTGMSRGLRVPGAAGADPLGVAAELAARFDYRVKLDGDCRLRIRRDAGDIVVSLHMEQSRASSRAFEVGATVGVSGADTAFAGWIDSLLPPPPDRFATLLDTWSRPGTALRDRIRALLEDQSFGPVLDHLAPIVLGDETGSTAADRIVGMLVGSWEEALNERITVLGARREAVIDALMAAMRSRFDDMTGQISRLFEPVLDRIATEVDAWQRAIDDAIAEQVQALQPARESAVASLARALAPAERVGATTARLITDLDRGGAEVTAALRDLLARYQSLRQRLHTAAKAATRLKLALAWKDVRDASSGDTRLLELRFHVVDAATEAVFRRLVLGVGAIDTGELDHLQSAGKLSYSGSFATYARSGRSTSVTIDLFGFTIADTRLLSAESRIEVDTAGNVRVLDAAFSQSEVSGGFGEQRAATLVASFDLMSRDRERLPGIFSLDFALVDTRLTQKELRQFLGSFAHAQLLTEDTIDGLSTALASAGVRRRMRLGVILTGLDVALQVASRQNEAGLRRQVLRECMALIGSKGPQGRVLAPLPPDVLMEHVEAAGSPMTAKASARRLLRDTGGAMSNNNLGRVARALMVLHGTVTAIPTAVRGLGELHAISNRLSPPTDEHAVVQARVALQEVLERINRALVPIVDVKNPIGAWISERLPTPAIALLASLKRMGGDDLHAVAALAPADGALDAVSTIDATLLSS